MNKKLLKFSACTFLLAFCSLSFSCNKDQMAANELKGQYKIEGITSYENGLPVPVTTLTGRIEFNSCKVKASAGNLCSGWIDFHNKPRITFDYCISRSISEEKISISNVSDPLNGILEKNTYAVVYRSEHYLTLKGPETVYTQGGIPVKRCNEIRIVK